MRVRHNMWVMILHYRLKKESTAVKPMTQWSTSERIGIPEHFTATIVGHQSARSENKLTYGLYSAGISDEQKRGIIDRVRLPAS